MTSNIVTGATYERTWIGHKTAIYDLALAEGPFAQSIDVQGKGQTYTLKAIYAFDPVNGTVEVPQDNQEIDCDLIQQSIFANPTFRVLPGDVVQKIRSEIENKKSEATGYTAALQAIYDSTTNPTYQALAKDAYDLLLEGTENFEIPSFTMNRTRTVSRKYAASQIDLSSINKMYTTAQLAAITGEPLLWTIPSVTLTAEETTKNLFAGWRKRICKVSTIANGSRQMIEQWLLGKHSLRLYQTAL